MKQIETLRLLLRPIEPGDAEAYFLLESNPQVKKFLGETTARSVAFYRQQIAAAGHSSRTLGITLKNGGLFIGRCGFTHNALVEGWEINIVLGPLHWGCGYGKEVGGLLQHGFDELRVDTIFGAVDAEHSRSIALCKSLDMQFQPQLQFTKLRRPVQVFTSGRTLPRYDGGCLALP